MMTSRLTFKERLLAALCYVPPLFVFAVFEKKKSDFLAGHIRRGLLVFLYGMCAVCGANALGFLLAFLPVGAMTISMATRVLAWLFYVVLMAFGAERALRGEPAQKSMARAEKSNEWRY